MSKVVCASDWLPGFAPEPELAKYVLPEHVQSAAARTLDEQEESTGADSLCGEDLFSEPEEEVAPAVTFDDTWRLEATLPRPSGTALWPALDPQLLDRSFPAVTRYDLNCAAVKVLRAVEAEGRVPSLEEREALQLYTGWGALPQAFNREQSDLSWVNRTDLLESFLGEEDFESARASVNNAHFTPPEVIEAVWAAVRRLGFTGGRTLETSAGVGYFLGLMPQELAARSQVTAVEIDRVAGRILSALYSRHGVSCHISPFEKTNLPQGWFDLVIGNVPFGDYRVADFSNAPYSRFSIHNYFIARALDLVRPGGLVCVVTSIYTMDQSTELVRNYLSSQAHLLGAIRLPSRTFGRLAGTMASADILFLRKRERGEASEANWVSLAEAPQRACANYGTLHVNQYFRDHPEMLVGKLVSMKIGAHGSASATEYELPLAPALAERVARLPAGVFVESASKPDEMRVVRAIEVDPSWKPGSYRIHDGRLVRHLAGELVDVQEGMSASQVARVCALVRVRDRARALIQAQAEGRSDESCKPLRAYLNDEYDRFVAKYGYLSSPTNVRAFRGDPERAVLLGLEVYDDEEDAAAKAEIFRRNTLRRIEEPQRVGTPEEALIASMCWRGCVHPAFMGKLLDAEPEQVLANLEGKGLLFHNPETLRYEPADEYLSGNVRKKLRQAAVAGPRYAGNVEALDKVIPADIEAGLIVARLGAVWVPAEYLQDFLEHLFGENDAKVRYCAEAGAWSVAYSKWQFERNVRATQQWGTGRMNGIELMLDALNGQTPTVKDQRPDKSYVVNRTETVAAREKLDAIQREFGLWLFADPERRERLVRIYNDSFNSIRPRQFDGSYLKLPGFSGCIEPYPHTLNGVARILQRGNALMGHAVGSGKTALAAIASMELRRLGLANKPCHVVPNNCLLQYAAEFQRLYPTASLLVLGKEDMEADKRQEFIARVATGNWDAVIIAHSSFELISMSPEYVQTQIGEVISEIEMVIRAYKASEGGGGRGNRIVKQLEKMKKAWNVRLEKLADLTSKDDHLYFEQLGIDQLFIDEAHFFKNLFTFTKMPHVPGLPSASSQRAFDMWMKTRYVMSVHDDEQRGVVFMTATFVCNTVAEIHVFQRYLQPRRLQELGLESFDAWITTFAEVVSCLELSPEGKGYRLASRLARFNNVPELMALFGEVADIQTDSMLKLPKPEIEGGKPHAIVVPTSDALREYVNGLVVRAEKIRSGSVPPNEDNMLAVTGCGRKAALDMRIVMPMMEEEEESKLNACAKQVFEIWQQYAEDRAAQLVFCDFSTPKPERRGGFCAYDELRTKLERYGIPAEEIRYIQEANTDAQKSKLFRQVRSGRVRVLLGSTVRMGVGTNVQERLIATHLLTIPWRPDEVEQADGRIVRPGNRYKVVKLYRYLREGSFDVYQLQLLETKARFIAQVMSGNKGIRSIEDVSMAALTYAEIKALASGNPLVIEKAAIDADVAKLSSLFSVWQNQRWHNESEVSSLPATIARYEAALTDYTEDAARVVQLGESAFDLVIGGQEMSDYEKAGEGLRKAVLEAKEALKHSPKHIQVVVGAFNGFALELHGSRNSFDEHPSYVLRGKQAYGVKSFVQGPALVAGLRAAFAGIPSDRNRAKARLDDAVERLAGLDAELKRPFEHEARLESLLHRQRELDAMLDLDKANDGGIGEEPEAAREAA